MADKKHYDVELAKAGFANGISTQLADKFKKHKLDFPNNPYKKEINLNFFE